MGTETSTGGQRRQKSKRPPPVTVMFHPEGQTFAIGVKGEITVSGQGPIPTGSVDYLPQAADADSPPPAPAKKPKNVKPHVHDGY